MPQAPIQLVDLPFPLSGVHESSGLADQPPGTSPEALNVRSYDLVTKRERGCQRVGLIKAVASNQTGEGIDLMCVGYVGKVAWSVSSAAGTGDTFLVNAGLKLERHSPTGTLTLTTVSGLNPGTLTAGSSPNSFVHAGSLTPNPGSVSLGVWNYGIAAGVVDDNGSAGDGAASRTLVITGVFGTILMKQAGELSYTENFAYTNGALEDVDSGAWIVTDGGDATHYLKPQVLNGELSFPATGILIAFEALNLGGAQLPAGTTIDVASTVEFGQTQSSRPTKRYLQFADGNLVTKSAYRESQDVIQNIFTTGFVSPGTGFALRVKFSMDATKSAYLSSGLKNAFDAVSRSFTAVFVFSFITAGALHAEFELSYNTANGWRRRTSTGGAFSGYSAATEVSLDGTENVFEIVKSSGGTAWTINGTSILTSTVAFPTDAAVEIHVNHQWGVENNNVQTGWYFPCPLRVTEVTVAGDKPASSL